MPTPKPKERLINFYLDETLIAEIDAERKRLGLTRKKYVEEVLIEHLRNRHAKKETKK